MKPWGSGTHLTCWLLTQLFNFWGSYKVVDSESFNFYFLGFWASEGAGSRFLSWSWGQGFGFVSLQDPES